MIACSFGNGKVHKIRYNVLDIILGLIRDNDVNDQANEIRHYVLANPMTWLGVNMLL